MNIINWWGGMDLNHRLRDHDFLAALNAKLPPHKLVVIVRLLPYFSTANDGILDFKLSDVKLARKIGIEPTSHPLQGYANPSQLLPEYEIRFLVC